MPPVRTQINCPNCRQPITADVEQVFDLAQDPDAKRKLLSGQFNQTNCPHCGFTGPLSTPLLYHDPEKELLLTFSPPELNLSANDRERSMGTLINKVVDALPPEQRKGYLFNPQATLTLQGLVERILQEDGVTKEMIDAQRKKTDLLQRLISLSDEALAEAVKEEDELIDSEFFTLLSQLGEASMASGDQNSAKALAELQQKLLPITTFGRELQAQSQELEAAVSALQTEGEDLTRERLLELIIEAPNEVRLSAFVSLARQGMDYEFFQLLTTKIDNSEDEEKETLSTLREKLLELTALIDKQVEERTAAAHQNVERLLEVEHITETTLANAQAIDEFFIQALNTQLESAKQNKDTDKEAKLMQVVEALNQLQKQAAGPQVNEALLQELLAAPDDDTLNNLLTEHKQEITPEFVEMLTGVMMQLDAGEDKESAARVRKVYRAALRISMTTSMGAG